MDESAEEMAERYGVKKTTIYNWATAFRKEEESIGKTDISKRLKVDTIEKKEKPASKGILTSFSISCESILTQYFKEVNYG